MIDRLPQLILFDGPQGSGKTSAANEIQKIGYRVVRGIPTTERLIACSPQAIWNESVDIMKNAVQSGDSVVFDRSLWSLVAFHMNKDPQLANHFMADGISKFDQILAGIPYRIVMLDSEPVDCFIRNAEDSSPVTLRTMTDYEDEIGRYRALTTKLKDRNLNLTVARNVGPKHLFLSHLADTVTGALKPSEPTPLAIRGILTNPSTHQV